MNKFHFTTLSSLIILFFFHAKSHGQIAFEEHHDGISKLKQREIGMLHELIILNIDSAERKIDALKKEAELSKSSNFNISVLCLEAELYRSKGDYVHMKLAYYQGISWKNDKTGEYQKLLLEHIGAVNEGVKGNINKQKQILNHVIEVCKKRKYYFLQAKATFTLAKLYNNQENFDKAHALYNECSKIFKEKGYKCLLYETTVSQAISYYWEQDYESALKEFHRAKTLASKFESKRSYSNALINLAEAHLFIEGSEDSAKYYFDVFLRNKKDADIRDVYNCYWNLEEYFNQRGNSDSAYHYLKLAYETDNLIRDDLRDKNRKEIDLLYRKLQNQKRLEDDKNYQELLTIIFALSGGFLILVIFVFSFILKEKSKINATLSLQNDEILLKNKIIDDALKEKDLLLKEIHHRVKNNLQIVSSLLNLQIKNNHDEVSNQIITEAKERIQAIALIHKKLYLDNTFAEINMEEYLNELIDQLRITYNSNQANIAFQLKTNNILLNIDTAVPLGLIISELTTNAFKYAFHNRENGRLKIEINHTENDYYVLNVKDNGIGMKENFNFLESNTLGVEIVQALTEQLDGILTYKSDENGTSIKIKFKIINGN